MLFDGNDKVRVIDSKSAVGGMRILVHEANKYLDKPLDFVVEKINNLIPRIKILAVPETLDYLHKGGRCSSLAYLGANLLKIRPQIVVRDGKMVSGKKYRGNFAHVVKNYCKDVFEEFATPDLTNVFLTYTTADNEIIDSTIELLKERGFENIMVTRAGGTITSHCGEYCLGILYINDGE